MEELREKTLSILDFDFRMIEKEKKCIKELIFNELYGKIDIAYQLNLLTFEEWKFLFNCLKTYQIEIFPQEENKRLQTTLDLIKDVVAEKDFDCYKELAIIDDVLDEEFGSKKYKLLNKDDLSMKLYETVLLGIDEVWE